MLSALLNHDTAVSQGPPPNTWSQPQSLGAETAWAPWSPLDHAQEQQSQEENGQVPYPT